MEDYEALPENDEVRGLVGGAAPWILALLALLAEPLLRILGRFQRRTVVEWLSPEEG